MLKSSGSSYLISGANKSSYLYSSSQINVTATESIYFMRELLSHLDGIFVWAH
jgi:predicted metal-binding protein